MVLKALLEKGNQYKTDNDLTGAKRKEDGVALKLKEHDRENAFEHSNEMKDLPQS